MRSFRRARSVASSWSTRPTRRRASSNASLLSSPAVRKWPTGVYAGWYPIKAGPPVERAASALAAGIGREALRLELLVDRADDPDRLNGSGLFVVNPPWTLAREAEAILPALASRLARGRFGGYRVEALK